jgi:inosose dehydratase
LYNAFGYSSRAVWINKILELKEQIYRIHWKDLPQEWEAQRGKMWGCGMGVVALGDGVIDVAGVFDVLKDSPLIEHTTLEVAGDEAILKSYDYLKALGAE